jgi:hypothetical protein
MKKMPATITATPKRIRASRPSLVPCGDPGRGAFPGKGDATDQSPKSAGNAFMPAIAAVDRGMLARVLIRHRTFLRGVFLSLF